MRWFLYQYGKQFTPFCDHKLWTTLQEKEYSKVDVLLEDMGQT